MEILKFESAPQKGSSSSKSSSGPILALVGIIAVAFLGSTLAASITLNSSQAVEFGQGVSVTSSCDVTGGITLAPSATFVNTAGAGNTGVFNLGTISFSGIDSTCAGKVFTLKGYDNTAGSAPLTLVTTGTSTTWNYATFAFSTPGATTKSSNANVGNYTAGGGTNGTIDLGWSDTRTVSSQVLSKFTLESSSQ